MALQRAAEAADGYEHIKFVAYRDRS